MNNSITHSFALAAGAVIGSIVTWKVLETKLRTKYEQIAQEEINSVKEVFTRRRTELNNIIEEATDILNEQSTDDVKTCEEIAQTAGYTNYSDVTNKKEVNDVKRPYVIKPEEFGETDYETISLTYYADGVLTDDTDEPIDDVDDVVGLDSLNHFGEYEDDSVFVRNDEHKCDYEILMDVREYYNR